MGIPIAGWMLNSNVLVGTVYDDNVFQSSSNAKSAWGARIQPSFDLTRNNGIHKTTIYGFADTRFYDNNTDDGDVFNAKIGAKHVWEVQRDLIVTLQGDFSRKTDINNSGSIVTANGIQTIVDPLTYNELGGSASVFKSFDRMFFGFGFSGQRTTYDNLKDSLGQVFDQSSRDQTVYTFTGRTGVWVSPVFYTFVEPSFNTRSFANSAFDSDGTRIVAGIGSDRIGLFQGEIYGGYQQQDYDQAAFGTVEGSVFGGKVYWYPTRDLIVGLNVNRELGDSTLSSPGNAGGSPVESTSFEINTNYLLTDIWSLSGRAGYEIIDYKTSVRNDDRILLGTTISYYVWRNLALTFDYQYIDLNSNIAASSFNRNMYTFGGTYKF